MAGPGREPCFDPWRPPGEASGGTPEPVSPPGDGGHDAAGGGGSEFEFVGRGTARGPWPRWGVPSAARRTSSGPEAPSRGPRSVRTGSGRAPVASGAFPPQRHGVHGRGSQGASPPGSPGSEASESAGSQGAGGAYRYVERGGFINHPPGTPRQLPWEQPPTFRPAPGVGLAPSDFSRTSLTPSAGGHGELGVGEEVQGRAGGTPCGGTPVPRTSTPMPTPGLRTRSLRVHVGSTTSARPRTRPQGAALDGAAGRGGSRRHRPGRLVGFTSGQGAGGAGEGTVLGPQASLGEKLPGGTARRTSSGPEAHVGVVERSPRSGPVRTGACNAAPPGLGTPMRPGTATPPGVPTGNGTPRGTRDCRRTAVRSPRPVLAA